MWRGSLWGGVEYAGGMKVWEGGVENSCGMEVSRGAVEYLGGMEVSSMERPATRPPRSPTRPGRQDLTHQLEHVD